MINDYFEHIFDSFIELKGDRKSGEDRSVPGGLAYIDGYKVVVIGFQKIISTDNVKYPEPEGFRKSIRLMSLAETFNKPVLAFIDIPETNNNASIEKQKMLESTVHALEYMLNLKVPIISAVISMNNSLLTLDLCAGDKIILHNGASFNLYISEHNSSGNKNFVKKISLVSDDLVKMNIVDRAIEYLPADMKSNGKLWRDAILDELNGLIKTRASALIKQRFINLQRKFKSLKSVNEQLKTTHNLQKE
ncbi:MAG: hypothetical protein ACPL7B_03915 [Candidatus Poribacteria bacterium]